MEAMDLARLEMTDITTKLKLQRALRRKVPPATNCLISPGKLVYVHNEHEKESK